MHCFHLTLYLFDRVNVSFMNHQGVGHDENMHKQYYVTVRLEEAAGIAHLQKSNVFFFGAKNGEARMKISKYNYMSY